jgi:hypothetical protein
MLYQRIAEYHVERLIFETGLPRITKNPRQVVPRLRSRRTDIQDRDFWKGKSF